MAALAHIFQIFSENSKLNSIFGFARCVVFRHNFIAEDRCSSVLLERINLKPLLFRLLKIFAEILYADIFRTLRSELHNDEFCRTLRTEI